MLKNNLKINNESGSAMLTAVVFFMFISLLIVAGLVSPSVVEFKNASVNLNSKVSYALAESGVEDAVYRLKNNKTIGANETIILGSNSAATTIVTNGNQKTIESVGNVSSYQRKIDLTITTGAGVGFNYGLQTGAGGINMQNSSDTINGSVYTNGKIVASGTNYITGSAIAADSPALAVDQSNIVPTTPTNSINFGNVSASQDYAQSFQVSANLPLNKVQFYIKKNGSPGGTITVRLVADNAGSPSTVNLPLGTATLGSITTSYSWVNATFTSNPALVPNTTYWIVLDYSTTNVSNYYIIGANADSSYGVGTAKTGVYSSGTWVASNLDSYFQIYTGGVSGSIGGAGYASALTVGTGSVGDTWASNVSGTTARGNMYCNTGSNNNKSCTTNHGIPPQVGLPFTSANIASWETAALAGGTQTGDLEVTGGAGIVSLGPKKIVGNLHVGGSKTFLVTGTLWVTGNITIDGSGHMELPSNYALNSETIVADGKISLGGSASLGSGNPSSFLFVVSNSRCPYDTYCSGASAISVSGAAGAIAVDAQYGDVSITGSSSLCAAVGNSMTVTGSDTINYNSGLASPYFKSGPSGSWNIDKWQETQ